MNAKETVARIARIEDELREVGAQISYTADVNGPITEYVFKIRAAERAVIAADQVHSLRIGLCVAFSIDHEEVETQGG